MKIIRIILPFTLAGIFLLTGCEPAPQGGGGPTEGYSYAPCPPASMVAPTLISLPDFAVRQELQAHFEWEYPGYVIINGNQQQPCETAGFHMHISSGPYFQDELGGDDSGTPGSFGTFSGTWSTGLILEEGTEYHWSVQPFSDSGDGPISETRTFYTGPLCEIGNLVQPHLLSPINHWVVNTAQPTLTWLYPEACLPDYYFINVSPNMQFDNSPWNGTTLAASTSWSPVGPLNDCTRYFWEVEASRGGQVGQPSQVYTFYVNLTGNCPAETLAMIQGTVWEDQCVGPGPGTPVPDPLPLGCALTAQDTIFPNQTYDPGEPGIPGLIVRLAQGACPSASILRDVPTWGDGMYDFYMVNPGTYCVIVDSTSELNAPVLQPGNWTAPEDAVNQTLANRTITVGTGQDLKGIDFGWWYKYGTGWGSTNATVFGLVWHDLCAYTPGDPVPNPLPDGCVVDEYGTVSGDGIHQPDEPGIAGVTVDIGAGDCPSSGSQTAITDAYGWYAFTDMNPGTYCLRIDPAHGSANEPILMPGRWTYIPSGHEGMTFRLITLTANHTLPGVNFGWDYDALPEPTFTLNMNTFCRLGPDILYDKSATGMSGEKYPIVGTNPPRTWYLVQFEKYLQCWFPNGMGIKEGSDSDIPVVEPPPLTIDCSAYRDQASCMANAACTWAFTAAGPGYCKAK